MIAAAASEAGWRYGVDAELVADPAKHSDVLSLKEACASLHAVVISRRWSRHHITVHATPALIEWGLAELAGDRAERRDFAPSHDREAETWLYFEIHGVTVSMPCGVSLP